MQAEPIIVDTPKDVQQHCNIEGNDILYPLLITHPSMLGLNGLFRLTRYYNSIRAPRYAFNGDVTLDRSDPSTRI